ncbi:MAG: VOC family protein [Chloroflexota bacterium]
MKKAHFKAIHPVLPVRDVPKAIKQYVEKLGFELIFVDSTEDNRYAGIQRGNVMLHLQWHDEVGFDSVEKLNLRFEIDDVDALFTEYENCGLFHEHTALRDTPWGTREFAFYDMDSNGLTFYRDL